MSEETTQTTNETEADHDEQPKGQAAQLVSKWRKRREPVELPLSSGASVMVRAPSAVDYFMAEQLPARFLEAAIRFRKENPNADELQEEVESNKALAGLNHKERDEYMGFVLYMLSRVMVEPRCGIRGDGDNRPLEDDEVAPEDIPPDDFWEIFTFAANKRNVKLEGREVSADRMNSFRADGEVL